MTEPEQEADFVSARHFDIEDVARWFGVAPDELQKIETFRTRLDQRYAEASQAVRMWAERYFHLPSSDVNAQEIGKLQARVSQLEGEVKALREAIRPVVQLSPALSPGHSHEDSGMQCAVSHNDGQGNQQPQCKECKYCGEFIRPEAMGQECPGKQPIEGDGWSRKSPPGDGVAVFDTGPETPPHPLVREDA